MLTRKQAREQPCRRHVESIEYDYHFNGTGVAHKIPHYHQCVAEQCPMWVDSEIKVYPEEGGRSSEVSFRCEHVRHGGDADACMSSKQHFCSECPYRFGRCGS